MEKKNKTSTRPYSCNSGGITLRAVQRKSDDTRVGPSCGGGSRRHHAKDVYNIIYNNNIHTRRAVLWTHKRGSGKRKKIHPKGIPDKQNTHASRVDSITIYNNIKTKKKIGLGHDADNHRGRRFTPTPPPATSSYKCKIIIFCSLVFCTYLYIFCNGAVFV